MDEIKSDKERIEALEDCLVEAMFTLQSAREEIKELTDNGAAAWKSVSDLIQERDTLKAEAARMREERDIVQSMFSKVVDCVIRRFRENSIMGIRQDVMRICTEAEERLKTPAAPEKD